MVPPETAGLLVSGAAGIPLPGTAGILPAPLPGTQTWHSRGYLPHLDQPGLIQMITFRLADALPAHVLSTLPHGASKHEQANRRIELETHLDAGHGRCLLREERVARMVEAALAHFDGTRYHLLAWVVMPTHVHVAVEVLPGRDVAAIVQNWKSFTSKKANRLLARNGRFWQPEYFDRAIRDERHYRRAVEYVRNNPVKAGLVDSAEEWPFSSASSTRGRGACGQDARGPREQGAHCPREQGASWRSLEQEHSIG